MLETLRRSKAKDPEGYAKPENLQRMARKFLLGKRSTNELVQTVRDIMEQWPDEWENNRFLQALRKIGVA